MARFVLELVGVHADADDAADLRRFDEEGLDAQADLALGQMNPPFVEDHVVVQRARGEFAEARMLDERLADVALHHLAGLRRRRTEPEQFQVEQLVVDLEHREQHVRAHHAVDRHQQLADVFAPVLDDVGGDDELLEQADLELEDVLVDGDAAQLGQQFVETAEHPVQLVEAEVVPVERDVAQVAHRVDVVEALLDRVDRALEAPADPPDGGDGGQGEQRQEGEQ